MQAAAIADRTKAPEWSSLQRSQCEYQACYCEENVLKLCQHLSTHQGVPLDHLWAVFISNPHKSVRPGGDQRSCVRQAWRPLKSEAVEPRMPLAVRAHITQVPIWRQRASRAPSGLVVWDYHVILVQRPAAALGEATGARAGQEATPPSSPALVWDLDTTLSFPCPPDVYCAATLAPVHLEGEEDEDEEEDEEKEGGSAGQFTRYFRVVPGASYLQHFASDRRHMKRPTSSPSAETQPQQQPPAPAPGAGPPPSTERPQQLEGPSPSTAVEWTAAPPPWPCPVAPATGATHTLPQFWDVGPHNRYRAGDGTGGAAAVSERLAQLVAWAATSQPGAAAAAGDGLDVQAACKQLHEGAGHVGAGQGQGREQSGSGIGQQVGAGGGAGGEAPWLGLVLGEREFRRWACGSGS